MMRDGFGWLGAGCNEINGKEWKRKVCNGKECYANNLYGTSWALAGCDSQKRHCIEWRGGMYLKLRH